MVHMDPGGLWLAPPGPYSLQGGGTAWKAGVKRGREKGMGLETHSAHPPQIILFPTPFIKSKIYFKRVQRLTFVRTTLEKEGQKPQ